MVRNCQGLQIVEAQPSHTAICEPGGRSGLASLGNRLADRVAIRCRTDLPYSASGASLAYEIQDTTAEGEPHKLQKLILRSSRVVHPPHFHRTRCVGTIGTPDLERVRQD